MTMLYTVIPKVCSLNQQCDKAWEMQIHMSYPRLTESEALGVESRNLCCDKPPK